MMGTDRNLQSDKQVFLGMEAIFVSAKMRALMDTVQRVARTEASVLITGESGTGKELIARAVHHYSRRAHRPWVDLSCAALPEHLVESELFGYDRGAFSGADGPKQGLFELAHTGTIFLDEIGELTARMQVKLLRVLDGVPYFRLGGVRKISVDTRVVAATNMDLEKAVAEGSFRGDLYHRLGQFTVYVPPLRERRDDIAPLARHFLTQHDRQHDLPQAEPGQASRERRFSADAIAWLESQPWQGNIRELRNAVIKAALLTEGGEIQAAEIPRPFGFRREAEPRAEEASAGLEGLEKQAILFALKATGGHQSRAAERLGISRRTLSRKLKLYESERAEALGVSV